MRDPIRWLDDHDAGSHLTRTIMWLVGAAAIAFMLALNLGKLINGPTMYDRIGGVLWVALSIYWAIRGINGWRAHHAR
jgi:multisubunit Na+/H+ antiporter MnhF subunit